MKANKIKLVFIICLFISCTNNATDNNQVGFICRIHVSSYEIDWYRILGSTNLNKHLEVVQNIDWEKEYWKQWNSKEFNMPCIEVFDTIHNSYLTISVCPKTESSFQYEIGLGKHATTMKDGEKEILRKIKVYGSETTRLKKVKKILIAFFKNDDKKVQKMIDEMFFLYEIEDLYLNLE